MVDMYVHTYVQTILSKSLDFLKQKKMPVMQGVITNIEFEIIRKNLTITKKRHQKNACKNK